MRDETTTIWKSLTDRRQLSLIAGPCVIENERLGLRIAASLRRICEKLGVYYVFKARRATSQPSAATCRRKAQRTGSPPQQASDLFRPELSSQTGSRKSEFRQLDSHCRHGLFQHVLIGLALLGLALGSVALRAATPPAAVGGRAKGFTFPHTDERGQKLTIKGDARTLKNGQLEFTPGRIETYRGATADPAHLDMIIEAPHCVLDNKNGVAFSPGDISVRTTDERFSIRGAGFLWQLSDSRLFVSNQVHTVIQNRASSLRTPPPSVLTNAVRPSVTVSPGSPGLTNAAPPKPELIDVQSDRFEYSSTLAVFRGHVVAQQEEGTLTCGTLTVTFDQTSGGPEKIQAEDHVVFIQKGSRMTGDQALFLPKENRITLSGHAAWSVDGKDGTGDIIQINNQTREFHVERNVLVTLVPDQMLSLDWLARSAPTNSVMTNRPPLKIQADELDYRTNAAVFRGTVRVDDSQGGGLTCGRLTNFFAGPNGKLVELVAQDEVVFHQGETGVTADRAVYRATNETITLTGNPAWKIPEGSGRSELLVLHPRQRQFVAERNVSLTLLNALTNAPSFSLPAVGLKTNAPARPGQNLIIFSDRLRYQPSSAIFLGGVRVTAPSQPEDEIACEVLAAFFSGASNKLDQLVAEDQVRIRQGQLRATGHKATFSAPRGLIELSGNPQTGAPRITRDGQTYTADQLILDRLKGTYRLKGHPRVEVEPSAGRQTLAPPRKP